MMWCRQQSVNHQGLRCNLHCATTVVLREQLNFNSAVIRSVRSSCLAYALHVNIKCCFPLTGELIKLKNIFSHTSGSLGLGHIPCGSLHFFFCSVHCACPLSHPPIKGLQAFTLDTGSFSFSFVVSPLWGHVLLFLVFLLVVCF